MTVRAESDEKYILDLVAEVLSEPDYRWQHRFPTLLGDPGKDGRQRRLPVDGYFPRHRLIVEYWERQHSAPVEIMDEGLTVSGVSRGHRSGEVEPEEDVLDCNLASASNCSMSNGASSGSRILACSVAEIVHSSAAIIGTLVRKSHSLPDT